MGTFGPKESSNASPDNMHQAGSQSVNRKGKVDEGLQFVEFILGKEYFAVNLFHTREVLTPSEITPLPSAPPYIKGVMDLRGSITTIIDLKTLMHITTESINAKRSRIIILDQQISEKPVGILVDDVYSVSTHTSADIDREADHKTHNARNIMGIIRKTLKEGARETHKLILWLDIQSMMASIEKDL
ncbi:MAG TPA: chemotaxis protein CheW [Methanospirillum sp.]|nr:chemotaxis protein CheW [Methanospirillum sp.]